MGVYVTNARANMLLSNQEKNSLINAGTNDYVGIHGSLLKVRLRNQYRHLSVTFTGIFLTVTFSLHCAA